MRSRGKVPGPGRPGSGSVLADRDGCLPRRRWHTGFVDALGAGGLLGQVEGRTVADVLAAGPGTQTAPSDPDRQDLWTRFIVRSGRRFPAPSSLTPAERARSDSCAPSYAQPTCTGLPAPVTNRP
ncbi:hypothetical protein FGF04_11980 [Streptomyces apricus]|uniref:Uncharacterized protein n=1 Tax=Streptomyces apricus TaxID=1828112 RepID=A0A5B0BBA2_9ACTN|nr:hypothetical protein FGF04_11980 [Streptomyces apricus]